MATTRFAVFDPYNWDLYMEYLNKLYDLNQILSEVGMFMKKLDSYNSIEKKFPGKFDTLPSALRHYAFLSNEWRQKRKVLEATSSRIKEEPYKHARWFRACDGTITTMDLGPYSHWKMHFDKDGNVLKNYYKIPSNYSFDNPYAFAIEIFNQCDVLVMEDFRKVIKNKDILSLHQYAWLYRLAESNLYHALSEEAKRTRRRLILIDPTATSWTCHACNEELPLLLRYTNTADNDYYRFWSCPKCNTLNERNHAACQALLTNFIVKVNITYDNSIHGPGKIKFYYPPYI